MHIVFKMKNEKPIIVEIEIPQDVTAEIEGKNLKISGPKGIVEREIPVKMEKEGNKIILKGNQDKREKKMLYTFNAHIKNMVRGAEKGFEYKLQICSVHFPMAVRISPDKRFVMIKNFLGETKERVAEISEGVDVTISETLIKVISADKEKAGQTAANIEKATKIRSRDRRVFQDGIYLTEKSGRKI